MELIYCLDNHSLLVCKKNVFLEWVEEKHGSKEMDPERIEEKFEQPCHKGDQKNGVLGRG